MINTRTTFIPALFTVVVACTCPTAVPRDARWAHPIEQQGLDNLHLVTPTLYRGAQPGADGFRQLARMKVRTIVNLRAVHSDLDEIESAGLPQGHFDYREIPMLPWHIERADVLSFLRLATDPRQLPLYVHCQHGADRTGTVIAAYRMVVQGWTAEQAIAELALGGFGYHTVFPGIIDFLESMDVVAMRQQLPLPR